ncbi:MAG: patatin-like phospholipase family protein [Ginsengibacter sp.]|jgi:NTE family protein
MKLWLILLFLFPLFVCAQNKFEYKNLVMEGGGVRGLAYSGALEVLEQKGILHNIENVAGSSAGAIAGLMVALNYSSHEIDSVLQILRIQEFNDGKFFFGKIKRLRKEYGVFKGEKFEEWLGDLIKYKTGDANVTFEGLHQLNKTGTNFKNFFCTGTNISKQRLETFSWKTWPEMKLRTAVHISGSIPFYFVPVAIDSLGNEVSLEDTVTKYDLYVDGGMLCNYPINMFDSCIGGGNPLTCEKVIYNMQTLGLKLERGAQIEEFNKNVTTIAPYHIKTMKQYSSAVMNLMMESINRKSADLANEKGRTIYISYGDISGRPRKISLKEKKLLQDNGVIAANKFFSQPSVMN